MDNINEFINDEKTYDLKTKSPGKILVCGGYLVINPNYRGLVLCTKTYFNCNGKLEIYTNKDLNKDTLAIFLFSIYSANFKKKFFYRIKIFNDFNNECETNFNFSIEIFNQNDFCIIIKEYKVLNNDDFINLNSSSDDSNNNFIDNSLKCSIYFIFLYQLIIMKKVEFFSKLKNKIFVYNIDLDADYRFYATDQNNIFQNISQNIKTGLGSSSGLITSLTSNIIINFCRYFNKIENKSSFNDYHDSLKLCVLLSSYCANNLAQNKVIILNFLILIFR